MASPTQWTWVWVNSRRWWWTGRPGVLRFMGSQRVGHDWATELNWAEEPEIKLPTSVGSSKKQESSRKTPTSALLTTPKHLTVWITTNCGKFWKRWEYKTTSSASWEVCMQVKKQQLELDMEQQTGSKLEKKHVKAVYCHPAYLTYMQKTSCEWRAGWSRSWNQDCWEKYQ